MVWGLKGSETVAGGPESGNPTLRRSMSIFVVMFLPFVVKFLYLCWYLLVISLRLVICFCHFLGIPLELVITLSFSVSLVGPLPFESWSVGLTRFLSTLLSSLCLYWRLYTSSGQETAASSGILPAWKVQRAEKHAAIEQQPQ